MWCSPFRGAPSERKSTGVDVLCVAAFAVVPRLTKAFYFALPSTSMASTEVVDEKDRRTPPKSPLAADAKPFVPSASPVKAAPVAAAEEPAADKGDAEKEQEEDAKESEEEATDEGDDNDREAEEQPAPVTTVPVFTDQQRSRPSMQVRRGRRGGEPASTSEGTDSGALGACQLCTCFDLWRSERERHFEREAHSLTARPPFALRFQKKKNPKHTHDKIIRRASSSSAASRTGRRSTRLGSTPPSLGRSLTSR